MDTSRRWRLILGREAEEETAPLESAEERGMDDTLEALYGDDKQGGLGDSVPRLHRWMTDLRTYFPARAIPLIQQDALAMTGIADLLLEPELLAALEPDAHLAGILLQSWETLDDKRREAARMVIDTVARQLMARIKPPLHQAIRGRLQKDRRLIHPPWSQVDWHRTIRRNLRHYQPDRRTLIPETRIGWSRKQRRHKEVVLLVDQSASMASSLIYAGIHASILAQMPTIRLSILAFDTRVLDLTRLASDPTDLLLGFHLGGGTDIGNALVAAEAEILSPKDAVVVLISDLFDGGPEGLMEARCRLLQDKGVRVIALLALGPQGAREYDEAAARRLIRLGIPAFACGLEDFPELMGDALTGADLHGWTSPKTRRT